MEKVRISRLLFSLILFSFVFYLFFVFLFFFIINILCFCYFPLLIVMNLVGNCNKCCC